MTLPPENTLCYGDCLDWMRRWDHATVDLIYLDPPFNSNATYNVLYAADSAGGAQERELNQSMRDDTWGGRWHDRCSCAFTCATGAPAFGAVFSLTG